MAEAATAWSRETVPRVFEIVSTRLPQRDAYALLLVSPWCYRSLLSQPILWQVLDLHEMSQAGERLISALSLGIESLQGLESLNLNGCQKISDKGIEAITSVCPNLRAFSIYWNVRITDLSIKHLANNCKRIIDLNLSGCKVNAMKSSNLTFNLYKSMHNICLKGGSQISNMAFSSSSNLRFVLGN